MEFVSNLFVRGNFVALTYVGSNGELQPIGLFVEIIGALWTGKTGIINGHAPNLLSMQRRNLALHLSIHNCLTTSKNWNRYVTIVRTLNP